MSKLIENQLTVVCGFTNELLDCNDYPSVLLRDTLWFEWRLTVILTFPREKGSNGQLTVPTLSGYPVS